MKAAHGSYSHVASQVSAAIIMKKPEDEVNFLEDYGACVIAEGNSMMEALLAFEEKKHEKAGE